ncbi:MAG TPA: response regulator, partial [Methylomirabilota bacterium]|nr:response regulator [Methylomirabilota bacterium]
MDGFAVCRTLRERDATRLVPVVVMTALQGVENRVKLLQHGADDVLTKPVDERELIARVQAVLARKRAVDQRLGEITRVRDHFAKFVPDAVKRLVAANPDAPSAASSTASPTRAVTSTRRRVTASWPSSKTATPPLTACGRSTRG